MATAVASRYSDHMITPNIDTLATKLYLDWMATRPSTDFDRADHGPPWAEVEDGTRERFLSLANVAIEHLGGGPD